MLENTTFSNWTINFKPCGNSKNGASNSVTNSHLVGSLDDGDLSHVTGDTSEGRVTSDCLMPADDLEKKEFYKTLVKWVFVIF